MTLSMIEVRYKCACMEREGVTVLRERRPDEDIGDFMHRVQEAITSDHHMRSMLCQAVTMEYAKLPAPDSGVGRKG
jgi:hypothetical protein